MLIGNHFALAVHLACVPSGALSMHHVLEINIAYEVSLVMFIFAYCQTGKSKSDVQFTAFA